MVKVVIKEHSIDNTLEPIATISLIPELIPLPGDNIMLNQMTFKVISKEIKISTTKPGNIEVILKVIPIDDEDY